MLAIGHLNADIAFYRRELARAKSRLHNLTDELKMKKEARRVAEDYEDKTQPKGHKKFSNKEFAKIYQEFKALLPKKLKPVFENNPFKNGKLKK